jgi:hypothetical protein
MNTLKISLIVGFGKFASKMIDIILGCLDRVWVKKTLQSPHPYKIIVLAMVTTGKTNSSLATSMGTTRILGSRH